jgi:uncharacterized protein
MTGMGGGSLMTPMLILFFKFDPAIAVGTDILHGAIFKSFGAARHRRLGTVRLRLGLWMLVGSAPMSLVGVWTVGYLTHRYGEGVDSVQGKILAIMLIVGGLAFLAKAIMHPVGPGTSRTAIGSSQCASERWAGSSSASLRSGAERSSASRC